MGAEQRSLRDRPRNRPENDQRGNGPHFELSEMVAAHAANCRQHARPTSARGVRKQPRKTIHDKCVLIDAGCGQEPRFFCFESNPQAGSSSRLFGGEAKNRQATDFELSMIV